MAKRKLTDKAVAGLKPKAKRYAVPVPGENGLYVRVTPAGGKSYVAVARAPSGKQVWHTLGEVCDFPATREANGIERQGIERAADEAREVRRRIRAGLAAVEPKPVAPESFRAVAENYIKRYCEKKGLISSPEIRRHLQFYVYPRWADRPFVDIRRRDVAMLLDEIEDKNGGSQADAVLATVRGIMSWYASRDDDYASPIVRRMRRTSPKERERDRVLDNEEFRLLWAAAEKAGTFGALCRFALLTAQRRAKVAEITWTDLDDNGCWRIRAKEREKGTGGLLKLPDAALAIINSQPRIENNEYIFAASRGNGPFDGWSKCKAALDVAIGKARAKAAGEAYKPATHNLAQWQFHDLRRTAKTLMSAAAVDRNHSEQVLGHTLKGVEGTYDRYAYSPEKAEALQKLADKIERILYPLDADVTDLNETRAAHG